MRAQQLTVLLLLKYATCQISIIGVDIDLRTQTFQFPPLNRNSTANTVIGTVNAVSGAAARFQYALTDVILNGKPTSKSGTWVQLAKDFNNDDCSEDTLAQYPKPRKFFCIDHNGGNIYTTKYYVEEKPESGVFFKFPILYRTGIQSYSEVSPHSVRIFSNCDELITLYNSLKTICDNDVITMGIGSDTLASQKLIEFNISNLHAAFLTLLKVKILNKDPIVGFDDVFTFKITVNNLQSIAKLVVLPSQNYQVAYMEPPLRLTKGDKYTIILMHTQNNETNQINFNPSLTRVVVLNSRKNYCLNSPQQCQLSANKYQQVFSTITQECINIDELNFYPKFGYCLENPSPQIINTTVTFDWDTIQQTQQTVSILSSNYVSNIQGKDVQFTIVNIASSRTIPQQQTSKLSAHTSCSNSNLDSLAMPRSFFCINTNDGGLYTTSALVGHSLPIDDFTITIQLNVLSFPPMFVEKDITVRAKSDCRVTTSLFRELSAVKCHGSSFFMDFQDETPENQIKSSYSVNIKLPNNLDKTSVLYFAGLKWRTPAKRVPNIDVGSYTRFTLKGGRKTANANFFYIDDYMSFTEPLEYQKDASYKLSATRFSKVGNITKSLEFDLSELQISMVIQEDYCSLRIDCADLYNAYQEEYLKTKTLIDTRCADPNYQGYKIMYGYCKDNNAPKVLKTSYLLNINTQYVKAEVIPGRGQHYVTDENPLIYEIIQVTDSKEKGSNTGNNAVNILTPNECTQKFTTYPSNYFCINKNTGKIYTTSVIEGNIKVTSKFTIIVKVSDVSVFPIRILNVTLTLDANDKCSPASLTYNELSKCVKYAFSQPISTADKTSLLYNVPVEFQAVIAVRFRLDDMKISNGAFKLSLGYDVRSSDTSVLSRNTTPEVVISTYLEEYSTAEITVVNKKDIRSINVTFYETFSDGKKQIVETNSNSAFLLYIQSFQCNKTCISQFDTWTTQAATKDPSCRQDPSFYGINFGVCKDTIPKFSNNLTLSSRSLTTGMNVSISNCSYQSPYKFSVVEWLQDGQVIKTIRKSPLRKRRSITEYPNLPKYMEENFYLQNAKLIHQGSYSCRMKDGSKVATSNSIQLNFKDVAKTTVEFVITNHAWNAAYNDINSVSYKDFQKQVQDQVRGKLLADGDPDNLILNIKLSRRPNLSTSVDQISVGLIISYAGSIADRQRYCRTLSKNFFEEGIGKFEVEEGRVFLKHFDCCNSNTKGEQNYKGIYVFPTILVGQSSYHNCTYGSNGENMPMIRQCIRNVDPEWEEYNDTICQPKTQTTKLLIYLFEDRGSQNAVVLSRNLSIVVQQGSLTNQVDIQLVTDLISQVVMQNASNEKVTFNVLNTVDGVLDTPETVLVDSNKNSNTSTKLLQQLDQLAASQQPDDSGKTIEMKNIGLAVVKPLPDKDVYISSKKVNGSENIQMHISKEQTNDDTDASIKLPSEAIGDSNLVYSYVFKKTSFFQSSDNDQNDTIQSSIMSATVVGKVVANLTNRIEIEFDVDNVTTANKTNACKFFVEGNATNSWSSDGCITVADLQNNKVKCLCAHLTNFAILLDTSQSGNNPLTLQVITWIGCGISLAGLIITIISNVLFPKLRKKLPSRILVSLSVSLSLLLIIFLAGAEATKPRIGCQLVAGLLQYFILSTFCWMAVEGLNLYRNFVKVFSGGASNTKFFLKASAFAWGLPAVITIVTGAIKPDHLGPDTEDQPQFCVVRGLPFFFAVLAPVVLVLLGNMIVLVLVLRGIQNGSQLVKDSKAQKNKKMTQARIAFACAVLLGLTWVFAILAVGGARDFFQWLFCIFNSLQGFFIFVFYTLRSAEVKRQWKVFLGISAMERTSTSSKWHSKYISVYRLTHIGSIIKSRKASVATKVEPASEANEASDERSQKEHIQS